MTNRISDDVYDEQAPTITRPANSNVVSASLYDVPDDKIVTGTIINYGTAPYKFDKDNNPSFYLNIRSGDTTRTLWGLDLERALTESSYDIEDEVAVYNKGRVPIQVMAKIRDAEGKVIRQEPRTVMKGAWHIGPLEEYVEARSQQAKRNQPQQRYANTQRIVEERPEYEEQAAPRRSSPSPRAPLAQPVAQPKTHFSAGEFETVQKIWTGVPRRTSIHSETGYYLVVDEKRTVIVTKDEITFARKPKHRLDQAYAASCEHARQFWGGQMEVHGDSQHLVKAWAYASVYGFQVTNFTPTAAELCEAEKIISGLRKTIEPSAQRPTGIKPVQGAKPNI